ncbi:MAG: diguanylate cyclase, partial [Chloroflexota bacterium]
MNIWAAIPLVTCVSYVILLVFILQQVRGRANKIFAFYIGIAAFWSFSSFMLHLDGVPAEQTMLWNQILVVALVWTLIAYYHFVRAYTNQPGGRGLYIGYIVLVFLAGFAFSGNIIEYSYVTDGTLYHGLGASLYFIMAVSLTYAGAIFVQLIKKYRSSSDPIDRNRTMYLLAGWSVLAILTLTNGIPSLAGLPLDHMGSFINALIISYAISRLHLFNIRLVARRGLSYFILAVFIIGITALFITLGFKYFADQPMIFIILVSTLFVFLITMTSRPLTGMIEENIDRLFYRKNYDSRRALLGFKDKMGNILDLDELAKELLPSITGTLHVSRSELLFQDNKSGDFKVHYAYPKQDKEPEDKLSLNPDNPVIAWLDKRNSPLYIEQIDNIAELKGLWQTEKKQLEKSGLGAFYPFKSRDKLIGVLALGKKESGGPYSHEDMQLIAGIANQAGVIIENAQLYQQARTRANTDELTGLYNHRSFHERIEQEIARGSRFGGTFSLIMLDIDLFKTYNDIYGHQAGDRILQNLSERVKESIRNLDMAFRYGGEEFAIILPETRPDDAYIVAERIRRTIETKISSRAMPITISLGISSWPTDGVSKEEVIACADAALYR